MKSAFLRFAAAAARVLRSTWLLAIPAGALLFFLPLLLPAQDILPGPARALGHCECTNCELARGMAVDRYSYDPASEDSEDAGRAGMTRASDKANTDAHAANPLCQAPCTATGVTFHFDKPSFFSANPPGKGEAHDRWRVTGSCKKPPEQPQPNPGANVPPEKPATTPGGGTNGGSAAAPATGITPASGINLDIAREMKITEGDKVEVAPMVKKGDSTPGPFTPVPPGDPFGGLLGLPGITPGVTDPETLKGKPGVLDIIKKGTSEVINKDGARATMGYFIRVTHADGTVETFFILMSYDLILINGAPLAAFEVFKFGPITDPDAQPPLVAGLAVDKNGNLLAAVPLGLAKVNNFISDAPVDKPVTPGVDKPGEGCLECHSQTDDFPSETLPFPWIAKPRKAEKTDNGGGFFKNFSIGIGVGVGGESGGHHGHESHGGNENHGGDNNASPPENDTLPPNNSGNEPPPPPGNR